MTIFDFLQYQGDLARTVLVIVACGYGFPIAWKLLDILREWITRGK
jgi:hypothetical protein